MNDIIERIDPDFSTDFEEIPLPQSRFVWVTEDTILEGNSEAEVDAMHEQHLHAWEYSIME